MINYPIIQIMGLTASGKTVLAKNICQTLLAKKKVSGIDIICVDSRQIYADLPILSGADLDEFGSFKLQKKNQYWQSLKYPLRIFNSCCQPIKTDFSLASFIKLAEKVILHSIRLDHLVVLLGGSFLYQRRLFDYNSNIFIPPNLILRKKLANLTLQQIQNQLLKGSEGVFFQSNIDDLHNRQRLIRYLEVINFKVDHEVKNDKNKNLSPFSEIKKINLVLSGSNKFLKEKIKLRIQKRLQQNVIAEVQNVLIHHDSFDRRKMPIGFEDIEFFLNKQISFDQLQNFWLKKELEFLRRQIIYLKKYDQNKLIIVNQDSWLTKAINSVLKYY